MKIKLKKNYRTNKLYKILQNQKNELNSSTHLISHELKYSLINVSDLLTWTQEDIKETKNFKHSKSNLKIIGERIESTALLFVKLEELKNITPAYFKYKMMNIEMIAMLVIDRIKDTPNISTTITNELPSFCR